MSSAEDIVYMLTEADEDFDVKEVSGPPPPEWKAEVRWDEVWNTWAAFYTLDGVGLGADQGGASEEDKIKLENRTRRNLRKMRALQKVHPFPAQTQTMSVWEWLGRWSRMSEAEDDFSVKDTFGNEPVPFTFKRESELDPSEMTFVYAEDYFIGTIKRDLSKGVVDRPAWMTTYSPKRYGKKDNGCVFSYGYLTRDKAAEALWHHFTGKRKIVPESRISEGVEEPEDSVKDVYDRGEPDFRFVPLPQSPNVLDVFDKEKWLGRIIEFPTGRLDNHFRPIIAWQVTWFPNAENHERPKRFDTPQEAAQWMWDHHYVHGPEWRGKAYESGDDMKDVYSPESPTFTFLAPGQLRGNPEFGSGIFDVYVDRDELGLGEQYAKLSWIGRIQKETRLDQSTDPWKEVPFWTVTSYTDRDKTYPVRSKPEFKSQLEAAEWIWAQRISPRGKFQFEDQVKQIVLETIGEEDDMKDYGYNPLSMAVTSLTNAGFKVEEASEKEGWWKLVFSFPRSSASADISSFNRAKEALKSSIPIRAGNFTSEIRDGRRIMTLATPIENNPARWEVRQIGTQENRAEAFFNIIYNGEIVGEVYCESFGGAKFEAEEIRKEMVALDNIVPFDPHQGSPNGNAWGRGRAVNWWRANRSKIKTTWQPRAAEP